VTAPKGKGGVAPVAPAAPEPATTPTTAPAEPATTPTPPPAEPATTPTPSPAEPAPIPAGGRALSPVKLGGRWYNAGAAVPDHPALADLVELGRVTREA